VQYLVTECSLPQLLYYNEHYDDNICDVAKTRTRILEWYGQHDNINVMVERGDKRYAHTGRFQDEAQAIAVDHALRQILQRESIAFTSLAPDIDAINAFAAAWADARASEGPGHIDVLLRGWAIGATPRALGRRLAPPCGDAIALPGQRRGDQATGIGRSVEQVQRWLPGPVLPGQAHEHIAAPQV
jgi:hypothetical protein